MLKPLFTSLVMVSAVTLTACDKTSEDHAREAQHHAEKAQAKLEAGETDKAAQQSAKAQADRAQANDAAATEGRNAPPSSAVPGYIKDKP